MLMRRLSSTFCIKRVNKQIGGYMSFVMVVVAGCRCRYWGTANYFSILMRGRKKDYGRQESNPDPERSKPKALTTALPCPFSS